MWSEEELRKELKELIEYKAWIDSRIDAVRILLEPPPQGISHNAIGTKAARAARGGRLKEMADAIFPFLTEYGRPARREAMLEHLEKTGVEVTGETYKKKLALISSALSKDPRFRSMGRSTGQWDIDREHLKRTSMLQDRREFAQAPSAYPSRLNDASHYEQLQPSEVNESGEPSDADDLPW